MEFFMKALFLICGLVAVAFVLVISVYLIVSGIPAIREVGLLEFLGGTNWDPANKSGNPAFGILPMILTSVYGTAGAIVIGVPIGFLMAVFLSKVAPGGSPPSYARSWTCSRASPPSSTASWA